jgi:hypothetical protein
MYDCSSAIYLLIYCLFISKSILNSFKLEILSRGLTQVFTLTNKNRRRTELNENKNKFLDRGERREYSEIYFL